MSATVARGMVIFCHITKRHLVPKIGFGGISQENVAEQICLTKDRDAEKWVM